MKKFLLLFLILFSSIASAQLNFNTTPFWTSTDVSNYSTGGAWVDINNDGFIDLVVSNGNDMARQRVVVYLNNNGVLPLTPTWQSSDIDYHGHLSAGDINNDGFTDVAVSVYIGASGFNQKGRVKIYMNNNGTLSSNPSWISADSLYTFSCALGDADGDGDLDLAVACGEAYNNRPDQMRIYYNTNGVLSTLPGWRSNNIACGMDITFADINKDGRLDLVFVCERYPNYVYLNYGDSIAKNPSWSSTDGSLYANSLFVNDINNDGYLDLAVSDNNQLGGSGRFKIYMNNSGTLASTPSWTSRNAGYMSGINIANLTNDEYPELLCGGWWMKCWIYQNNNGSYPADSQWASNTSSVVEAIFCGDFDNDGVFQKIDQFTSNGTKTLYYVSKKPIHKLIEVKYGSNIVPLSDYCYDLENGWLSLKNPPTNGVIIAIKYNVSYDLDITVTNWDNTKGNYIFKNDIPLNVKKSLSEIPSEYYLKQNYPNPFNSMTNVKWQMANAGHAKIEVFNTEGKKVKTLVNEYLSSGIYEIRFDAINLPSGVYLYKLTTGNFSDMKKMIYLK
ncbi:MAG: VCBS repeat-containing protein [Ignavibacteria bacterium]|nr:VCBS repeat-containing protein [Ignavibacteria bacterium]